MDAECRSNWSQQVAAVVDNSMVVPYSAKGVACEVVNYMVGGLRLYRRHCSLYI